MPEVGGGRLGAGEEGNGRGRGIEDGDGGGGEDSNAVGTNERGDAQERMR